MKYPILVVEFEKPEHGYWDGGAKSGGTFTPECYDKQNQYDAGTYGKIHCKGGFVKWGSFALNYYFTAGPGKSWTDAASIAKRKLQRTMNRKGTITIEWEEEDRM